MAETAPVYVLDSFALLAYYQKEAGGVAVVALLEAGRDQKAVLHMSLINVGEMYYLTSREKGTGRAEDVLKGLRDLPVTLEPVTEDRVLAAARLKAKHAISYADAFAVALAQELRATVVTGDPEFKSVESVVAVMWLPGK